MKQPPAELADRLIAVRDQVLAQDDDPRLEDVAASIGASRSTLYYYFAGRDDLIAFLLTSHVQDGADAIRAADDPALAPSERLPAVVDAMVAYLGARPHVCAALLRAASAGDELADVLALNDELVGAPLRDLLAAGAASGAFALEDPALAADVIIGGVLLGVLGRTLRDVGRLDDTAAASLAAQLVRSVGAR